MPLLQYILEPTTPFHFGAGRDGDPADLDDLPRSDSLASALLSVWRHLDPHANIAALAKDPPFALSSAMPYLKVGDRDEPLLFVPPGLADPVIRQNSSLPKDPSRDAASSKKLRKARFASIDALNAMLAGRLPPDNALVVAADGQIISAQGLPLKAAGPPNSDHDRRLEQKWHWSRRLWHRKDAARPRLVIDRDTGHAAEGILFRYAATFFRPDLRLLIVAALRPSCDRKVFEAALRLLGCDGIGGGRSIGHGRFNLEPLPEDFAPKLGLDGAPTRMLLSLTHPTQPEVRDGLLAPPAAYNIIARGGWAEIDGAGRFRRAPLPMLTEGSIVRKLDHVPYGDSICVLKATEPGAPHDVFRSGCAVSIPINLQDSSRAKAQ